MLGFICLIWAYAMGCIPSAVWLSKIFQWHNPLQEGSGNPGATNMLRLNGWHAGILTFACDAAKSFLPVMVSSVWHVSDTTRGSMVLAAVIGHVLPWLRGITYHQQQWSFRKIVGGKGMATAWGGILAIAPFLALLLLAVWGAIAMYCRYASLASIVVTVLSVFGVLCLPAGLWLGLLPTIGILLWTHRHNWQRLRDGHEPAFVGTHLTSKKALSVAIKILDPLLSQWGYPAYTTTGSAGMDIRAAVSEPLTILPNTVVMIPAGFAMHLNNPLWCALVVPRSGLGHQGIILGNGVGVIDADYQGPLMLSCWNRSTTSFTIHPGDRIAQLLILPIAKITWNVVTHFETTSERSDHGFGSSGVQ
jgi:dUTP pyrophosphatase